MGFGRWRSAEATVHAWGGGHVELSTGSSDDQHRTGAEHALRIFQLLGKSKVWLYAGMCQIHGWKTSTI